jgi:hypothetical protein
MQCSSFPELVTGTANRFGYPAVDFDDDSGFRGRKLVAQSEALKDGAHFQGNLADLQTASVSQKSQVSMNIFVLGYFVKAELALIWTYSIGNG